VLHKLRNAANLFLEASRKKLRCNALLHDGKKEGWTFIPIGCRTPNSPNEFHSA
jgi:hypothetical protein